MTEKTSISKASQFCRLAMGGGAFAMLAACTQTPMRDTYSTISKEMKTAAQSAAAAPVPRQVSDALLPSAEQLAGQLPKARPVLEERFNVAFNEVPANQFFNSLVAGTRYNMLVHPEVSGTITANLKDVTIAEALEAVREMYGYDYRIEGTRITIKPLTMQSRMFQVNYLTASRRGSSNLRVTSTSVQNAGNNNNNNNNNNGDLNNNNRQNRNNNNGDPNSANANVLDEAANVTTRSESDFWAELKMSLEAIVGAGKDGRAVVISPQSGLVVIRGMPEDLRNVDRYLKATQLAVARQVILEAKILEVELSEKAQSGINWAAFGSRISAGMVAPGTALAPRINGVNSLLGQPNGLLGTPGSSLAAATSAPGSLFGLAFQNSNFAALISFLESQGTVHVLSSPRIATLNNQKAVLKIGTDEFFVTGVTNNISATAAGTTTTPTVTLQAFFSGVVLDVTPQIDEKGNILLHVHPSVSQVSTVNKTVALGSAGNLQLPLAASATSELDSIVRGSNGQVVAIGGLMRQSSTADNSQVPVAGSVPVLGSLFGAKKRVNQKRELVVLIKPTIVEGINNWNDDLLDAGRRIDQLAPRGMR